MMQIDLNADLGESFGSWKKGHDSALLQIVTSANIACGFHAGDPEIMARTCADCKTNGVNVGAHPGYRDLAGFGRREIAGYGDHALQCEAIYQIGALQAIASTFGLTVRHVKFHGAAGNMSSRDQGLAMTLFEAVQRLDPNLRIVVIAATAQAAAARTLGITALQEIFADRAYNDDGTLVGRSDRQAMVCDPATCAENMLRAVESGTIVSVNQNPISINPDTICVHGDTPEAISIADAVRARLEGAGISVKPF
ncbi:MAG: 5-oxoprolinase subunit PxpA [Rhodobacteraceae bacterium]|nr:5-oxoprolinase subunit PxpA [Paracoccaceae bacterium]